MLFSNYLKSSFENQDDWNSPGNTDLFIIENSLIRNVIIDANEYVTDIELADNDGSWNRFTDIEDIAFSVKSEISKAGKIENIGISFSIPKIESYKSLLVDQLYNTNCSLIIGDNNGHFWLLGYPQFASMTSLDYGATTDDNSYRISLSSKQKGMLMEVSRDFMATLMNLSSPIVYPPYIVPIVVSGGTTGNGSCNCSGSCEYLVVPFTNQTIVDIYHGYNEYVTVTVIDENEEQIICSVKYVSLNEVRLEFNAPFTGKAIIMGSACGNGNGNGNANSGSTNSNIISVREDNNAIIYMTNNDHFIRVLSGAVIYLPANPELGQMHIIKNAADGDISNVSILGNGHQIDGNAYNIINSHKGSITFIYAANEWNRYGWAA